MGRHTTDRPPEAATGPWRRHVVADREWAGDRRRAAYGGCAWLAAVLPADLANGTLGPARSALWTGLAVMLYAVLHPVRVTAGPGWIATRGLLRGHRVQTDLMTFVHLADGISARLVLYDVLGNRAEVELRILRGNPVLRHLLDRAVREGHRRGTLSGAEQVLPVLGARIDAEEAHAIFTASGLR